MVERIGNCRVLGEIGAGGMAVVYEAIQEPLNRRVAIKALKPSIASQSQFAARFEREAQFMASLQHENILHVIDFLKDGDSMYIVMEYVDGIDLYDLLEKTERLPPDIAAIITMQLARGLDYAHFRGILHRDIKPANIMISNQGDVKLMDFGIARHERFSDLTETGTGLGTPSYMSPEQIVGDKLDFRSDVFSVGIVLYQMLIGKKPFVEDKNRSAMQKIRLDPYPSPKKLGVEIPRELEAIMARCLEKKRINRYPSTRALADELNTFINARVHIGHNARLILYLKEVGVMTQAQADEILGDAGSGAFRTKPIDWAFIKRMLQKQAWALGAVVLVGGGLQMATLVRSEDATIPANVSEQADGFVRFIVDPWAEVYIDGEHVLTTPSVRQVALAEGKHYIKFRNPYFKTLEREIAVRAGRVEVVEVSLVPKVQAPEGQTP